MVSDGGYFWYQMGRDAAETERVHEETVRCLFSRRRSSQEANLHQMQSAAYANENAALRREVASLKAQLEDYEFNYDNLKRWADSVTPDLKKYYGQSD